MVWWVVKWDFIYMSQGWVKLHRQSLDSSVFNDPVVWMVWCWCLMKATHDKQKFPFNGYDFELQPGEFITGRSKAVEEFKKARITAQKWRTAMEYLKSTSRITIKTTNKFSLVTIIKWDQYQSINQQSNQPLTNQQPTTNHIQECIELKNEKKLIQQMNLQEYEIDKETGIKIYKQTI